ncbi:MAG: pyrroline-5-carboxylate reductase [Vallitaleaceae bacterium]|jgi:pyrroline-5-carboxylate reductase|nr:pyrroline-5-carboxylate reductase [Vallitaleaceae bacterium]
MKTIGFIGAGNMAYAMLAGARANMKQVELVYTDINKKRLEFVKEATGIDYITTNAACYRLADIIVLSIKPQYYKAVLEELGTMSLDNKILITIAPGISIKWIKEIVDQPVRVVRAMPNTPALVGEGMSCVCYESSDYSSEEIQIIEGLFNSFGKMVKLTENQLDMVVPVSGSSPAYVYIMIEAMADAGVLFGLSRDTAYTLAAQSVYGAAKMVLETGQHPAVLKDAVCSPGGTTIEAVRTLEEKGFRSAIIEAMQACYDKTLEFK